jgi:putative ABC transport system permease protein
MYKSRTLVAFLGVLIGIASIGFVLVSYSILTREMDANFMNTNPASIVLKVSNLDSHCIDLVKEMKNDIDIEARKTLVARIDRGNGTYGTVYLFAVENFQNLKVDTFTLEKGVFPEKPTQMALERDSLKNLPNLKTGYNENVVVKLPGGNETSINLSGIVHAPGLSPASMEKYSYAFLKLERLQALGYEGWYDEIHLVSYDNRFDRAALRTLAADLKECLINNGYQIERVDVPVPGKHPHGDQLKSLLFLLQAFTVISLLVACIIIINLLNFIMSRQTKQIAIMKSTGANTRDIAIPYVVYVLLISIGAIIISIPIANWVGSVYSDFAAGILNFKISSYEIPFWVYIVQVSAGILIPLISSIYPIYRNCKITVKEGLAEQTDSNKNIKSNLSLIRRVINKSNTKIAIPLNNVFRKKGRAILAILALATGGVLFMASQNIVASINNTANVSMNTFRYDYDIKLYGQYPDDKILETLSGIKVIDKAEIYKSRIIVFKKQDGTDSSSYLVKALPRNSEMVNFEVIEGSNIKAADNAIIINKALWDEEKWIQPGMTVTMEIGGQTTSVVIAGIVNEIPPLPSIYMNLDSYEKIFGGNSKQNILISTKSLTQEKQIEVSKKIEEVFNAEKIEISENWNISLLRKAFVEHLNIIVNFLSIMALLAIIVGGLSIASAIGINVSERKRELGILRAIGVNSRQMISMISLEVLLMGLAGWLTGLILAYPISIWTGNYFGQIFLHSDLNNTISIFGTFIWLAISIIVSFISGLIPARKTASASLKEMLTYE